MINGEIPMFCGIMVLSDNGVTGASYFIREATRNAYNLGIVGLEAPAVWDTPAPLSQTCGHPSCGSFAFMTKKQCTRCGHEKDISEFHRNKTRLDGRFCWCKACKKGNDRAYYENNQEKIKQRASDYYYANRNKVLKRIRADRRNNPEKYRDAFKKRYDANPEKYREQTRRDTRKHKDRVRKYLKGWHQNNQDRVKSYRQNRRARLKKADGSFTASEWASLKEKYHCACLCCGRSEPEIQLVPDHVIPLSVGGGNAIDNIQPLCFVCNAKKYTKTTDYRKRFAGRLS